MKSQACDIAIACRYRAPSDNVSLIIARVLKPVEENMGSCSPVTLGLKHIKADFIQEKITYHRPCALLCGYIGDIISC
jgi:hypothetical protein